ncbi:MAG TPA: GNAT family N-acetyltransferase [Stellaceae bacterium]|nr:GNAT family N-acetyltransferase [Stellaceae bacterium]
MITLRQAESGDVQNVRNVLAAAAHALTARYGHGHWSTVRTLRTLRKYAGDRVLYLVDLDDVPVGTLKLTHRKVGFYHGDWFADPGASAAYLMDMAIDPRHQRHTIGRRAMALAEEIARREGLCAVRLDAYRGPAGAGAFYRKCGYTLVHQGEINGARLEYYEKLLSPSADRA